MFKNIRIVLVNTTHPGNIGAVARAMKTMQLTRLYLVSPQHYPSEQAIARASNATDILDNAVTVDDFGQAIADCQLVIGTSSRQRALTIPQYDVRKAAQLALQQNVEVAIVLGQERTGLTNEQLALCHAHLTIPANPDYASLNLAAAAQIICYELKVASDALQQSPNENEEEQTETLATTQQVTQLHQHLQQLLRKIDFAKVETEHVLATRLQRLLNRAHLEQKEVNILRGILSHIEQRIKN